MVRENYFILVFTESDYFVNDHTFQNVDKPKIGYRGGIRGVSGGALSDCVGIFYVTTPKVEVRYLLLNIFK